MSKLTIPEQIDALLGRLRGAIRRYVLLRGVALLLAATVLVFWVSLLVDAAWFSATRLELTRGTRLAILIVGLGCLVGVVFHSLIWQMLVQLRRRALALLLEKRFPQLNDRLITVVEAAEEEEQKQSAVADRLPLSQSMLERTLKEACQLTSQLRVDEVFNPRPLQRSILLASVAVVSIAATALASPGTLSHWSNAYFRLADDYWNRVNGLQVFVLAQPGDRLRTFENRTCKHAAGSDLTILVETAPGKVTPPQVLLTYRTANGARSRALMTPAGDGKFRHTIGNLVDPLEFYITGGDFTTVEPYRIVTVPEPQIAGLQAECTYPEYTGWNDPDSGVERRLRISSAELTVPMETEFVLLGQSTKPLTGVRIAGREFELAIRRDAATGETTSQVRFQDDRGLTQFQTTLQPTSGELISGDGKQLQLPLRMTAVVNTEETPETVSAPLAALTLYNAEALRIYLEDTDGIQSLEPSRLQINGKPDEPPTVQTRLVGIGKAITRKAVMPFSGQITDDYGLQKLHFEYRLSEGEDVRVQLTARQPRGALDFRMERGNEFPLERFDVLPLELKVDDTLFVTLVATDGDDLNGPHITRGETYRMKIVSDEALLSLLYQDELNLRRRFEQVIEELTRSRDDLAQTVSRQAGEAGAANAAQGNNQVSEAVQRTLNLVLKDAVETDAIRAAFESIREELVNNRVDTPQIRMRLEEKIIQPLGLVLANDFAGTEEHLRLLDFALRSGQSTPVTAQQCVADLDELLSKLAQILLEMRKLESFQEVIELLKGIIEDERALKEKTEEERKKRLIDLLN